jgi:hypothetical protein
MLKNVRQAMNKVRDLDDLLYEIRTCTEELNTVDLNYVADCLEEYREVLLAIPLTDNTIPE